MGLRQICVSFATDVYYRIIAVVIWENKELFIKWRQNTERAFWNVFRTYFAYETEVLFNSLTTRSLLISIRCRKIAIDLYSIKYSWNIFDITNQGGRDRTYYQRRLQMRWSIQKTTTDGCNVACNLSCFRYFKLDPMKIICIKLICISNQPKRPVKLKKMIRPINRIRFLIFLFWL